MWHEPVIAPVKALSDDGANRPWTGHSESLGTKSVIRWLARVPPISMGKEVL
jgi:hypothetical protein